MKKKPAIQRQVILLPAQEKPSIVTMGLTLS
jgi:hypothetical protein